MGDIGQTEGYPSAGRIPGHVAIIMDGNGRWASQRGLPRTEGHNAGAESVRAIVRTARRIGVKFLTLFAFSDQNWDRPNQEVGALMELLYRYVLGEYDEILQNNIRLTAAGNLDRLPGVVQQALQELIRRSRKNEQMTLCLALSYGGHADLVAGARRVAEDVQSGRLLLADINAEAFESRLLTAELPPVDLLIRTSGEQRLSDFLPWHLAYAELVFASVMWPEFREPQFYEAIETYQARERRYGKTSEQLPSENPRGAQLRAVK
jgi:undecaprenyl diphosphate synthase